MPRTPFMRLFVRAVGSHDPSRRNFVRTTLAGSATLAVTGVVQSCMRPKDLHIDSSARVAIVGAGLAGLTAAWTLHRNGVMPEVYEASSRVGGRCLTARNMLAPGTWTELGGEFIDTGHRDMHQLVQELGLELIDTDMVHGGKPPTLFFHGSPVTEEHVVEAIAPYIQQIANDASVVASALPNVAGSQASAFDMMSIDAYFASIGLRGWIRAFLETAFVTENGLELGEQSAINFLSVVSHDTGNGEFNPFGESDERYVVRGGVQQITERLAAPLRNSIRSGHVLKRIEQTAQRYVLTFETATNTTTVAADHVVLAIPFTMLRGVDLRVDLPDAQRRAIAELRYGHNGKILMGLSSAPWRETGANGTAVTDLPIQVAWDNTHGSTVQGAGLTVFYGGSMSRVIGAMNTKEAAAMMMEHVRTIWPSAADVHLGRAERMHWPDQPFVRGSYSAYGVGQWTQFYGVEGMSVGNLHFAGEHCSVQHKGFMNGAAETGRMAAEKILKAR